MGRPEEDVRVPAQLIQRRDGRMIVNEIDEEVAHSATIGTG
jgi:hypothetical protein